MEKIAKSGMSGWSKALVAVLSGYRYLVSPWLPHSCRFVPSCSVYAAEAIERYGATMGARLGLRRLLRCHPGNPGGYDPVR